MAAPEPLHRVVVEVHRRGVSLRLINAVKGAVVEDERFVLSAESDDLPPDRVARDVFDLLYQCANNSINDGTASQT